MKEFFYHKNITESALLPSDKVPFSAEFREYCKENTCGRYGKTWNCPPAAGTCEELKNKALSYKNAFIFTRSGTIKAYTDNEGIDSLRKSTMNILYDICAGLRESDTDFFALGCESCTICRKCTYPDSPCRFPEKAFVPVEACGVDVLKLTETAGLTCQTGTNLITFFCIIFY